MTLYFGWGSFQVTIASEYLGIKSEGDICALPRFSRERQTLPEIIQTKGGLSLSSLNERNSIRTCIFLLWLQEEEKISVTGETPPLCSSRWVFYTCQSLWSCWKFPVEEWTEQWPSSCPWRFSELSWASPLHNLTDFEASLAWSGVLDWDRQSTLPT